MGSFLEPWSLTQAQTEISEPGCFLFGLRLLGDPVTAEKLPQHPSMIGRKAAARKVSQASREVREEAGLGQHDLSGKSGPKVECCDRVG